MTLPPCDDCGQRPAATLHEGGAAMVWHQCRDHGIGRRHPSMAAAAAWWRGAYARDGAAAPQGAPLRASTASRQAEVAGEPGGASTGLPDAVS